MTLALKLVLKLALKLVLKLVGWLKGQRRKMGVKGPQKKNKKDVSHRLTMPLAAGKNLVFSKSRKDRERFFYRREERHVD